MWAVRAGCSLRQMRYAFADCLLDVERHALIRDGASVRVAQVLSNTLENEGQVPAPVERRRQLNARFSALRFGALGCGLPERDAPTPPAHALVAGLADAKLVVMETANPIPLSGRPCSPDHLETLSEFLGAAPPPATPTA